MAACAVFNSENELVEIYASKKEAKSHNKGTDLKFVDAKNFPEGGIGEYTNVEDLFPPKEKPVKEGSRNRSVLEGAYEVVKSDGARCPEGDERAVFVEAMNANTTCEDFFAAVPESVNYTSTKNEVVSTTAKAWFAYAVRRGWVKLANANVEVTED